jgi:hypothetical protein
VQALQGKISKLDSSLQEKAAQLANAEVRAAASESDLHKAHSHIAELQKQLQLAAADAEKQARSHTVNVEGKQVIVSELQRRVEEMLQVLYSLVLSLTLYLEGVRTNAVFRLARPWRTSSFRSATSVRWHGPSCKLRKRLRRRPELRLRPCKKQYRRWNARRALCVRSCGNARHRYLTL